MNIEKQLIIALEIAWPIFPQKLRKRSGKSE